MRRSCPMGGGRGDIVKKLRTTAVILAGAALAAAVALAALVASSQPEPVERPGLISVGNVTATQVEAEVVSVDESSITVRADGEDVEIGCLTESARWMKSRATVGNRVWVSYFANEDGATTLGDIRVLADGTDAGGGPAPGGDGYLPVASIRPGTASSDGSPEGRSGGSSSHNWSLRGSVVEVVADSSCVVMATDDEGAGVLEPGLVTVFIDWSQPALPSVSEISVGASYEVRYMLPLLEPGYVAADTIEPL